MYRIIYLKKKILVARSIISLVCVKYFDLKIIVRSLQSKNMNHNCKYKNKIEEKNKTYFFILIPREINIVEKNCLKKNMSS